MQSVVEAEQSCAQCGRSKLAACALHTLQKIVVTFFLFSIPMALPVVLSSAIVGCFFFGEDWYDILFCFVIEPTVNFE